MRKIIYFIETVIACFFLMLFWLMRPTLASWLGGAIARCIGPRHKSHKVALKNIAFVFPHLSTQEQTALAYRMWWNLGRNIGEFVHNQKLAKKNPIQGLNEAQKITQPYKQAIIISGHFGNWELGLHALVHTGFPIAAPYRPANNPYFNWLMRMFRGKNMIIFPKGKEAARGITSHLKKGGNIGMLMDQKMNEGRPVPFFGKEAMTQTIMAEIAIKNRLPIIPARIKRIKGCSFLLVYEKPILTEEKTLEEILTIIHTTLEKWILDTPEQWFWVHNRWPKETTQDYS